LQAQAAFAPGAQALQRDVGRERIVARAYGRVAIDPIAGGELRRIRSDRAHPADRAGARHHRQFQQIFAFAAEDLFCVGQDAAGDNVDDDFAGAQHRVGYGLDCEW
jgi:hypothetical protein